MIDGIKILHLPVEAEGLLNNPLLQFSSQIEEKTGELLNKSCIAGFKGLFFEISPNKTSVEMRGSLHKYRNAGQHNWNDFDYSNLCQVINEISQLFSFDPDKTVLNNLEFGVNLQLDYDPSILLANIINYQNNAFSIQRETGKHFTECKLTRYIVKIYNKSLQYQRPENLLRFEVKIIKMDQLKGIGVLTLSNLTKKNVLEALGKELVNYWDGVLLYDWLIDLDSVPSKEREVLQWGRIQVNWERLHIESRVNYHRKRNQFEELVIKHAGRDLKQIIRNQIEFKWHELLNSVSINSEKNCNVCTEVSSEPEKDILQMSPYIKCTNVTCNECIVDYQEVTEGDLTRVGMSLHEEGVSGGKCNVLIEPKNDLILDHNFRESEKKKTRRVKGHQLKNELNNEFRICPISKFPLAPTQRKGKFLSVESVMWYCKEQPGFFLWLNALFLTDKAKSLPLNEQFYRIAHNIRNEKFNPKHNNRRDIKKCRHNPTLFDQVGLIESYRLEVAELN
jgi:hypothetical protein